MAAAAPGSGGFAGHAVGVVWPGLGPGKGEWGHGARLTILAAGRGDWALPVRVSLSNRGGRAKPALHRAELDARNSQRGVGPVNAPYRVIEVAKGHEQA